MHFVIRERECALEREREIHSETERGRERKTETQRERETGITREREKIEDLNTLPYRVRVVFNLYKVPMVRGFNSE